MAEFLTMAEAEDKFGKKGRTNAALTLGIIGTALGAFAGNNGGCGCGNGGGLLGNLFGANYYKCDLRFSIFIPVPSIAPLYCSPFTSYGTGMYAGTAAANFNAVNTAINTVAGGNCPNCTAQ